MMAVIGPNTDQAVANIVNRDWRNLSEAEMVSATWAYYFFSVQFRENLEIATDFFPEDNNLRKLLGEEAKHGQPVALSGDCGAARASGS